MNDLARRLLPIATILMLSLTPLTASAQDKVQLDGRPIKPAGGLVLGAYDPHGDFSSDTDVGIEHLFLPWEDVDLSTLAAGDEYARSRGRSILVTVEPWTWTENARITPTELLNGMMGGKYDSIIATICTAMGQFNMPTTIRWAQEMEDTVGRFTWAGWVPEDYIGAYRKFVTDCRVLAPNARFMWSPKGLDNLAEYYPGDDFVDDIGLSVFGLQKYDNDKFGRDRTFAELLKPGYDLVVQFNKPIYVAELGYVGDADYVADWANSSLRPDPAFPELLGSVYFNDKEVWPWPDGYGLPDWRVTENILE